MTDFPYQGTLAELRTVNRELKELAAERTELELQWQVLQEHRRAIIKKAHDNGGMK